jgi:ribose/xylose/arabinose/galactoside ABC-type transport system permease subunit
MIAQISGMGTPVVLTTALATLAALGCLVACGKFSGYFVWRCGIPDFSRPF